MLAAVVGLAGVAKLLHPIYQERGSSFACKMQIIDIHEISVKCEKEIPILLRLLRFNTMS